MHQKPESAFPALDSIVGAQSAIYVIVRDKAREGRPTALVLVLGRPFPQLGLYFAERNYSISRERVFARACCLLINFIAKRADEFLDTAKRKQLFNTFAHAVMYGTIRDGEDPSNLWWRPRTNKNVKALLFAACEFSDWLVERFNTESINPKRMASTHEQIIFWRRWNKFRHNSLLAHAKDRRSAARKAVAARSYATPEPAVTTESRPPYFPHERFDELLTIGFHRQNVPTSAPVWRRYKIRDMMVSILLHAGGVRVSEPFHIWLPDVYVDPLNPRLAVVRIYHPSDGEIAFQNPVTGNAVSTNRADYLSTYYHRQPLNRESAKNGWKGNLLQSPGNWMPVIWYPSHYGELFLALFKIYIAYVRPMTLNHPWLFVTEDGLPMTSKAFTKRHAAAVCRLGLTVRKSAGTTPHGHRHAYGQAMQDLREANLIDEKIFQLTLHHRSPLSQQAYNGREIARVTAVLNRASAIVSNSGMPLQLKEAFLL